MAGQDVLSVLNQLLRLSRRLLLGTETPIMTPSSVDFSVFPSLQSNPDVQDWMKANSLGTLSQLEGYFESRVLDLATLAGRSYIVWQVCALQ